jgi:hypothetical protein
LLDAVAGLEDMNGQRQVSHTCSARPLEGLAASLYLQEMLCFPVASSFFARKRFERLARAESGRFLWRIEPHEVTTGYYVVQFAKLFL